MNELGIGKLRGVLRRRKVPVAVATLATLGIGLALASQVESGYKAGAVIRAVEAQPAKEYVAPTVTEPMGARLRSLRLAVMARSIVEEAARAIGLDRNYQGKDFDKLVDRMRSRMDVKVEGEDTFLLQYSDPDPDRAQAVVDKMAQIFMRRQGERRQKIATATTEALRAESAALKPSVDAAAERVRDFKLTHYGALPEQLEANLRALDQATMEINIQSTNLDTGLERRRQLLASAMSPLRHHEEQLATQLYDSRVRYTDENSEVRRIQAQYEKVKQERKAEERDLYARLRRSNPELVGLEGEIARTRAILAGLRARQADFRKRVEATAKNGQELAALTAQYDALKEKYAATVSRLHDAELAERLESGLSPLRFELVDGAQLTGAAAFPGRGILMAVSLALAIGLGLGLGFLLDAIDTRVRDAGSLVAHTDVPVIVSIPHVAFGKGKTDGRGQPRAQA
jgi:uncharacterized protein involved in exopolysaccharide biosynthesis